MIRNVKSSLMVGLFMLLGGSALLSAEYKLEDFRTVIGSGGFVAEESSKGVYSASGVLGQLVIEDRENSAILLKQGFWVESSDSTTSVEDQIAQDSRFANFPNPFSTDTKIKYELPGSALVTIKVYDLVGNEVKTVFDGYQVAGIQELMWDGSDNASNSLASGSYICELSVRAAEMSGYQAFSSFVSLNVMVIVS